MSNRARFDDLHALKHRRRRGKYEIHRLSYEEGKNQVILALFKTAVMYDRAVVGCNLCGKRYSRKEIMSSHRVRKNALGRANVLLEYISKHFISLNVDDMKHYGGQFRTVLDLIIEKMKQKDKKFNECYQRTFYAGSYWDGLKVEKPTEFDVDIVIKLPFSRNKIKVEPCENLAFVKVKTGARSVQPSSSRRHSNQKRSPARQSLNQMNYGKMLLKSLLDFRGYLIQARLRTWMESVLHQALDTCTKEGDSWCLVDEEQPENVYLVKVKKSGPALTLNIALPDGFRMDVDLVPVIELKCSYLPYHSKLQFFSEKYSTCFIVPKPNKQHPKAENYWRLAFHEQERAILGTRGAGVMKPVCRLLKKLRDKLDMPLLASYYLKTLVLWEISEHQNNLQFFHNTMTHLFIHMVKVLRHQLWLGRIDYFWDENYNLLEGYDEAVVRNCYGRINNVVRSIEGKIKNDPLVLAHHLLNEEELNRLPPYLLEYV